jgi:hypothetical protein
VAAPDATAVLSPEVVEFLALIVSQERFHVPIEVFQL